jgi:hypothetical protein
VLTLEVRDLEWVKGPEDDPSDPCAHGRVALAVDGVEFVRPDDGQWTVSASALFLLRTLEHDHTADAPVSEGCQMFPCYGFSVWPADNRFGIVCMGCPNGVDPEIATDGTRTTIRLGDRVASLPRDEWRAGVLRFVDDVLALYARSSPKAAPSDAEDRKGWAAFWRELHERRERARKSR